MRKLLCCALCFVWLIGCGKRAIQPIAMNFSCDFTGEYDGLAFEGTMHRETVGTLSLSFTSPDSLSDVVCSRDGEKTEVTLGSMRYTVRNALPDAAIINMITQALDDVVYLSRAGTVDLRDAAITGEINADNYTAIFDVETSFIQRLEFFDTGVQIEFFNVKQLS